MARVRISSVIRTVARTTEPPTPGPTTPAPEPTKAILAALTDAQPILIIKRAWDSTPAQYRRIWKDGTKVIAVLSSDGTRRWTRVRWVS